MADTSSSEHEFIGTAPISKGSVIGGRADYHRQWREKNRDHDRKRQARWYIDNKAKRNASSKKWYENNKIRRSAAAKQFRKANPVLYRISTNKRRIRLLSTGSFTAADVEAMLITQEAKCAAPHCRAELSNYHVDHIVPISRGGVNLPANLQLLCPTCNLRKGTKTMEEWLYVCS